MRKDANRRRYVYQNLLARADEVIETWRTVRYWHLADMRLCTAHVRF